MIPVITQGCESLVPLGRCRYSGGLGGDGDRERLPLYFVRTLRERHHAETGHVRDRHLHPLRGLHSCPSPRHSLISSSTSGSDSHMYVLCWDRECEVAHSSAARPVDPSAAQPAGRVGIVATTWAHRVLPKGKPFLPLCAKRSCPEGGQRRVGTLGTAMRRPHGRQPKEDDC